MTIMVAGTGSFAKPFHINRHDPLIRSVNLYLEDSIVTSLILITIALGHVLSQSEYLITGNMPANLWLPREMALTENSKVCLGLQQADL